LICCHNMSTRSARVEGREFFEDLYKNSLTFPCCTAVYTICERGILIEISQIILLTMMGCLWSGVAMMCSLFSRALHKICKSPSHFKHSWLQSHVRTPSRSFTFFCYCLRASTVYTPATFWSHLRLSFLVCTLSLSPCLRLVGCNVGTGRPIFNLLGGRKS